MLCITFYFLALLNLSCPVACRILVPPSNMSSALEVQILNHWTTRDVPRYYFWTCTLRKFSAM